jgi:glycosyltransferase involved in cell wall biosynthesis
MRILIAHNVPRARTGGMSRIMGEIHDRLAAKGATVDYFCADDIPMRFRNRWQRFTYPYLVRQRALQGAYDIVNVHEPSGALVSRFGGKGKVVVTSHGVEQRAWEVSLHDHVLGRGGPSMRTRLLYPATSLWQSRMALRHADHIFCLNSEDRQFLTDRFAIPVERITRIYPAASPVYSASAPHRDYTRFRRILFAGTWLARKGNLDAVSAFVELAKRYPALEFAALGAGVPESVVKDAFPEPLRPRVSARKQAGDADAANAFAEADVFLLPSILEGTPLTLMEAMAAALPVITTRTCGMADVIVHGETGLLVPIRSPESIVQAFDRLAADATLRESLGRSAYAAATNRFTWEQSAAEVEQAYERLLAGR